MEQSLNTEVNSESDFRARFRNFLLTIIALMLGFGQWNDSKDLAVSIYEAIISNFTHKVEYKTLSQIDVGITKDYLEMLVGKPKVIKTSSLSPEHTFEYIFNDKYLLTAIYKGQRLEGFSVMATVDDFSPEIPFTANQLNSVTLFAISSSSPDSIAADTVNLSYFMETSNLGYSGMFLNRAIGQINYDNSVNYAEKLYDLQQSLIMGTDDEVASLSEELRHLVKPNFYALAAVDGEIINESLLTKYEYQRFY